MNETETSARDVLEIGAINLIEGLDDMLALDLRGHPRLELEATPHPGVREDLRQHHLESAAFARLEVDALVHGPMPPALRQRTIS